MEFVKDLAKSCVVGVVYGFTVVATYVASTHAAEAIADWWQTRKSES